MNDIYPLLGGTQAATSDELHSKLRKELIRIVEIADKRLAALDQCRIERDAAVQRYEDKRLEVANVCKDRASAEKNLAEARAETEAWIAKWKVQENYRIRCATQAAQIARLRESLEWVVDLLEGLQIGEDNCRRARTILAETAPL